MPKPYFYDREKIENEIVMVNHAGEYGAQRIYQGQLKYSRTVEEKKLIKHMLDQELEHLEYFDNKIKNSLAKPTFLIPLWSIFGYGIGAISSIMGSKTSMLVTENIEEVIVEHYEDQINYFKKCDPDNLMLKKIKKFKQDEAGHIHIATNNDSKNAKFYTILSALVRSFCKSAIFLSKKI